MNIFVTDLDPTLAAINLDDKRVRHMPKECIEMLAIYIHSVLDIWVIPFPLWGGEDRTDPMFLYNHPCSKWVRRDKANMTWLYEHTCSLFAENWHRFNQPNSVEVLMPKISEHLHTVDKEPANFQNSSLFKELPTVTAYRRTMMVKWFETDKIKPVKWTKRNPPHWIQDTEQLNLI